MEIIKRLFFVLILISSLSLISCGGGGGGDDDPEPYVRFSGGTYDIEWTEGLSDYAGGVPAATYAQPGGWCCLHAVALETAVSKDSFGKNSNNNIYIRITGVEEGKTYTGGDCEIWIRVAGHFSGTQTVVFTNKTVKLTKVTNNYVKGTFSGRTGSPENTDIEGSFVFKRTPDNSWPYGTWRPVD